MNKIEHVGIAVKSLKTAIAQYEKLMGVSSYKQEHVASEQVNTAFFKVGVNKIELLEGTGPDSAITKYLEKRGEGIHHIAMDVDDIYAQMRRLQEEGFVLLSQTPKRGADNKLICFVHPKDTHGVLIELCQELKERDNDK
ncbi:methylmalonyl-CoA epimerase [Pedobacter duraquae]|uniref:Methylmalonyl-CoA epimerase n=2 Tax=Pedobacter duraquae TaxID=425511 RepID=A0A4R6IR40_9SPHI|nr:methylmalonyl-CoA epimerase [Pedobacter duraquae]